MSARTSARLRPVSLSARHVIVAAATATLLFACAPHRPGASNSTPDTPPLPPPPGQLAGRVDTSTDKAAITAPEPAVSPMAGPLAQAPMPSAVEMAAPRIADGVQGGIVSGYPPPMALRAFAPAPDSLVPYGGYNRDGYYDILELNKTGVLDKTVRRIPASKEAQERAEKETYGTIRLLEDTGEVGVRVEREIGRAHV